MKVGIVFCLLVLIVCIAEKSYSQNTGIGTTNPTEKLDVNGNINLTGTIKANGVDGTAGQVLMKNSSGLLAWGNMCDFKNFISIPVGSGTWQVPAGVTKILVECWGGGGGGNIHGGGGGGGYVRALFNVSEFQNVNYAIGEGGAGALNANGSNGGTTSVSYGTPAVYASGGIGANYMSPTYGSAGYGGGGSSNIGGYTYSAVNGQSGSPLTVSYHQYSSTVFYQTGRGGNGGDAGNTVNTGGNGTFYVGNSGTNAIVEHRFGGQAVEPGGGGYGTYSFGGNTYIGGSGARGKIVIHY